MRTPVNRRQLLGSATAPVAAAIAGCGGLQSVSVTGASLQRDTVYTGQRFEVTATVTNTGLIEGTTTVTLTRDGNSIDTTEVTVGGDEETTVKFNPAFETVGQFELAVSEVVAGRITVVPALEVIDATVTPGSPSVGQSATVVATVRNRTPDAQTGPITAAVDGDTVATRTVTVPGEGTATVELRPSFQTPGALTLTIDGTTAETGTVSDGWREFGYDTTNSASPTGLSGPGEDPGTVWQQDLRDGIAGSPVAVEGTVYCGTGNPYAASDRGAVVAVSAADGRVEWRTDIGGRVDGTPTLADGLVVVGANTGRFGDEDYTGEVVAVEQGDGRRAWSHSVDGAVVGSPTSTSDTVYVSTVRGTLSAISVTDGTVRWERELDAPLSGPAVADGTLYVGGWDGQLRALSTEDGAEQWRFGLEGRVWDAPAVDADSVYVASVIQDSRRASITGSEFAAVSTAGERRWVNELDESVGSTPAVGADGVFAGVGLSVWGFDTADGSVRWRGPDATAGTGTSGTPAVVDGTVYGGFGRVNGGFVAGYSADGGTEKWRTAGDGATSSPAVLDGRLFIATGYGTLRAIGESERP